MRTYRLSREWWFPWSDEGRIINSDFESLFVFLFLACCFGFGCGGINVIIRFAASASASDKYTTEEIVVLLLPCTIPKAAC